MMKAYSESSSNAEWIVSEDRIEREKMGVQEAILTLGNGYLGSRGVLEEGYAEGYAGTYLAGVYDNSGGQSFAIVNAPNPLAVEVYVDDKKLSADQMEVVEHRRWLDMKRAVLSRHTIFSDGARTYEYESSRFFSLADIHVGLASISFRSLDADVSVVVKCAIDGTTRNEMHAVGGPRKHYQVTQAEALADGTSYLEVKTNDLGIVIGMATTADLSTSTPGVDGEKVGRSHQESVIREYRFRAERGEPYQLDQYISIHTSRETDGDIRSACLEGTQQAQARGAALLLGDHVSAWEERWRTADIEIDGDRSIEQALRFDMYHLLAAMAPEDLDVSLAPKTLSGEWYQGHVFWDTEIFMLPFFVYCSPELARNLLMYRARRLPQARQCAEAQNYKGALWPWESADSGREQTPETWVNFDGTVLPVYNATREHHIAADVIYAIHLYYEHTADEDFMLRHGAEMVFETARFWASRVVRDEQSGCYEIRMVIGPNEFQEGVDNNSYTNAMARWTLGYACQLYQDLRQRHPGPFRSLTSSIGLTDGEVDSWGEIAEGLVFLMGPDGLIEEFDGYFDRRDVTIREWDEHGMPRWPGDVSLAEVKETQLIKQADVILLLYLLSDQFSVDEKRVNFEYYEPRTTHMSSLSVTSYGILARELGDNEKAYRYLHHAARVDLENIHGNTHLGVHAAELGGAWQMAIRGFAGVRARNGVLRVNPTLPRQWESMRFRAWFRGSLVELAISEAKTEACMLEGEQAVTLEIYGHKVVLEPGRTVNVKE